MKETLIQTSWIHESTEEHVDQQQRYSFKCKLILSGLTFGKNKEHHHHHQVNMRSNEYQHQQKERFKNKLKSKRQNSNK